MAWRPFKHIHTKIIFGALIPILLVMGVITLLSLVTIENTALEVVKKRDAVLAEIVANRLSENLRKYPFLLQALAEKQPLLSVAGGNTETFVSLTRNWLHIFDGGIFIYTPKGKLAWSYPETSFFRAPEFPDYPGFMQLQNRLRPHFSDIISTGTPRRQAIMISVPIIGPDSGFKGVVTGICSLAHSTLGTTYTQVLEYKSGRRSYAILVDGNGRALYHRQSSLIGTRIEGMETVDRVLAKETGAMVAESRAGEKVIEGFAPVPDTTWGIVTQENWGMIQDLVRFYTRLFLIILWCGGTLSGLLVFYLMRTLLEPVKALTQGAEQIANGNFAEIPVKRSGDEIEVLSRQFNSMARATKTSFDNVNKRIQDLDAARNALKQSEEKISGIINAVNDAMFMVDDTHRIRWINDKGRALFGDLAQERVYADVLYRQDRPPDDCIVKGCFEDGAENDTEIKIRIHGRQLDFWCTANVVQRRRDGHVTRVVVVCRNLTEKKRLRAEVLRNAQLAALGELAAGVAHEINNPINGIINYAQILSDLAPQGVNTPQAQLPGRIIHEGERIAIIVSKLLSFARAGKEKKEPMLMKELVEDVLDLMGAMLKKERIRADLHMAPDLPAARGVLHQIRQIFLNIINNARYALNEKYPGPKAVREKAIEISCSLVNGESGPMVRTEFLDHGTGIPEKYMEKVLNPFFSTKPPDQGTGLGLSISYGIIDEHGGVLDIQSRHGQWTRVTVDIPMWTS